MTLAAERWPRTSAGGATAGPSSGPTVLPRPGCLADRAREAVRHDPDPRDGRGERAERDLPQHRSGCACSP